MWLRDPIEYFFTTADDQVDCFFMDDGARSARYTPLYTNSGFYFIRNNMRTQFFMHRMLMAYDTVLAVRSHQHALIMLLLEPVWKSTFYGASGAFRGDDAALLGRSSGEEPASPRHRAGRRVDGVADSDANAP